MEISITRLLFVQEYTAGVEYCYLAEPVNTIRTGIELGYDPELGIYDQVLKRAEWIEVDDVKDDLQVSKVIESLTEEEKNKYNINISPSLF